MSEKPRPETPEYTIERFDAEHPMPRFIADQTFEHIRCLFTVDTAPLPGIAPAVMLEDQFQDAYEADRTPSGVDINHWLYRRGSKIFAAITDTRKIVAGILGFAFYKRGGDNISVVSNGEKYKEALKANLDWFRVGPQYRHRGIGVALMGEAEKNIADIARGTADQEILTLLNLHPNNTKGLDFFASRGFKREGALKCHGVELPVMSKIIRASLSAGALDFACLERVSALASDE